MASMRSPQQPPDVLAGSRGGAPRRSPAGAGRTAPLVTHGRPYGTPHGDRMVDGKFPGQEPVPTSTGGRHLFRPRRRRSASWACGTHTVGTRDRQVTRAVNLKGAEGARYRGVASGHGTHLVVAAASVGTHDQSPTGMAQRAGAWMTEVWRVAAGLLSVRGLVLALAILIAVIVVRQALGRLSTRRALHPDRRVRLMVLPTETFDPSIEEVNRYAAQLSRTRRTVRGSLTRPAQAVRIRLDSVGAGQCIYRVEGSSTAASILRLAGYHEVDLRPADAVDSVAMSSLTEPLSPSQDSTDGDPPEGEEDLGRRGAGTQTSPDVDRYHAPSHRAADDDTPGEACA